MTPTHTHTNARHWCVFVCLFYRCCPGTSFQHHSQFISLSHIRPALHKRLIQNQKHEHQHIGAGAVSSVFTVEWAEKHFQELRKLTVPQKSLSDRQGTIKAKFSAHSKLHKAFWKGFVGNGRLQRNTWQVIGQALC